MYAKAARTSLNRMQIASLVESEKTDCMRHAGKTAGTIGFKRKLSSNVRSGRMVWRGAGKLTFIVLSRQAGVIFIWPKSGKGKDRKLEGDDRWEAFSPDSVHQRPEVWFGDILRHSPWETHKYRHTHTFTPVGAK